MATKMESALAWRTFCNELQQRLEALDSQAAALRNEKRGPALAAAQGDQKAAASLSRLNAKLAELAVQREDAALALQGAQEALVAAEAAETRAAEIARLKRLRELAGARQPIAAKIERALDGLVAALQELEGNSDLADQLLGDDRAGMLAWWSWQQRLPELLAARLDRAGIRLDLDNPRRAPDGQTAETSIAIGAAIWTDDELERLADGPRAA